MFKNLFILILLGGFFSSCVVNQDEFKQTQDKVYILDNNALKMNQRLGVVEKNLEDISTKLNKLETNIKASQTLKINELASDIKTLKNEFEDQRKAFQVGSGDEVAKEAIKDIYSKLENIENQMQTSKSPASPALVKESPNNKKDDKSQYNNAYKLFMEGKYNEAERDFSEFIENYKKSPLIDSAYFWLAECFFKKNNFEKAIINYDEVIVKYPKSQKVPAALLKQGICFMKLGEKDGAALLFNKIVKDFPKSQQAKYASNYLKELKK